MCLIEIEMISLNGINETFRVSSWPLRSVWLMHEGVFHEKGKNSFSLNLIEQSTTSILRKLFRIKSVFTPKNTSNSKNMFLPNP